MDYLQKKLLETLDRRSLFCESLSSVIADEGEIGDIRAELANGEDDYYSGILTAVLAGRGDLARYVADAAPPSEFTRNVLRADDPGAAVLAYLLTTYGEGFYREMMSAFRGTEPGTSLVRLVGGLNDIQSSSHARYGPQLNEWGRVTDMLHTSKRALVHALSEYSNYVFAGMESLYVAAGNVGMEGAEFDWLSPDESFNLYAMIYGGDRLDIANAVGDMSFRNLVREAEHMARAMNDPEVLASHMFYRYHNVGGIVTVHDGYLRLRTEDEVHLNALREDLSSQEFRRIDKTSYEIEFEDTFARITYR
jgi:hypothetical protein